MNLNSHVARTQLTALWTVLIIVALFVGSANCRMPAPAKTSFPCELGADYCLRVYWDAKKKEYDVDGKPPGNMYKVFSIDRAIRWSFFNDTDGELDILFDNFDCNNFPSDECPLNFDSKGPWPCSAERLKIPTKKSRMIRGDENLNASCPSADDPRLHDYSFSLSVKPPNGPYKRIDPQLQIDRGKGILEFLRRLVGFLVGLVIGLSVGVYVGWKWHRARSEGGKSSPASEVPPASR